jgi:hypothetical protein
MGYGKDDGNGGDSVGESGSGGKDGDSKSNDNGTEREENGRDAERAVNMRKIVKGTQKTARVNRKTEGESLYHNHRNTYQTDGRTILYTLKKKKLNQEQEQELVY